MRGTSSHAAAGGRAAVWHLEASLSHGAVRVLQDEPAPHQYVLRAVGSDAARRHLPAHGRESDEHASPPSGGRWQQERWAQFRRAAAEACAKSSGLA